MPEDKTTRETGIVQVGKIAEAAGLTPEVLPRRPEAPPGGIPPAVGPWQIPEWQRPGALAPAVVSGNLQAIPGTELGRGTVNANAPNPDEWRRMSILRKSEPLPSGHPYLSVPVSRCAACQEFLKQGDVYTLVALGPGLDKEQQDKCRQQFAYSAIAVPVHWTCATGLLP